MIGSGERRRKREWVACLIDLSLAVLHKLAVNQTALWISSAERRWRLLGNVTQEYACLLLRVLDEHYVRIRY